MKFISTTKLFLAITLIGFSFTSLAVVKSPAFYNFEYVTATSDGDNSTRMATLDASQNSETDKAVMAVPPNGECPEGWKQATPPLNPKLGCIPTTMSSGPNVDPSTGDSQNSETDKAVMAVPPESEKSAD